MAAIGITFVVKSGVHVTPFDHKVIMNSVSQREKSFLMNRTESKWGQD